MIEAAAYLERKRERVEAALAEIFPSEPDHPHRLIEAVRYALLGGGKRLRPVLALAACASVGGDEEAALPVACAIELVHAYSLVHDDLPAMDDDVLRRGRATLHVAFDEAVAILAGDALLTEAFALLARTATAARRPRRLLQAMRELAEAAGARGMVGGQAADLAAEGGEVSLAQVEFIHVRKTGALLLASIRAGALVGGASAAQLRRLTRYGACLGLAFQIADDILDGEGDLAHTGKTPGRDRARGKATFPAVVGMPAARQRARDLRDQALDALHEWSDAAEPLRMLAHLAVDRALTA